MGHPGCLPSGGGLHGLYLAGERLLKRVATGKELLRHAPVRMLLTAVTFALICITWVFFRARTFDQAFGFASSMLGAGAGDLPALLSTGGQLRVLVAVLVILWIQ